jgi:hypothetical protein
MPDLIPLPADYGPWLSELKTRIHQAQQRAARSVNRELVLLYSQIGCDILERQGREGWGAKVIERLATSSTCEPSPGPGLMPTLCKRCMHNCPDTTSSPCSTSSTPQSNAAGLPPWRSSRPPLIPPQALRCHNKGALPRLQTRVISQVGLNPPLTPPLLPAPPVLVPGPERPGAGPGSTVGSGSAWRTPASAHPHTRSHDP